MCLEKKIPDSKLGTIVLNQTAIQILEKDHLEVTASVIQIHSLAML